MSDFPTGESTPLSERRVHSRQTILFSWAEWGENTGGILLNISEGGFALQSVLELVDDELPKMRIQFSQCPTWIETKGRVAWRSESRKSAGMEFIDLSARARKQIQEWISVTNEYTGCKKESAPVEKTGNITGAMASPKPIDPEPTSPTPVVNTAEILSGYRSDRSFFTFSQTSAENQDASTISQSLSAEDVSSRPNATRRLAGTLLAVGLFSIFVLVGYHFGSVKENPSTMTSLVTVPGIPSTVSVASAATPAPASTSAPNPNPEPSPDTSGYVVQVGAMAHEENANALAESLRRRNFSAFVIKSETHRLYLVLVGPYGGANKISGVKRNLERQGFEAIRMEWNPARP